jgi:hypothetical protein
MKLDNDPLADDLRPDRGVFAEGLLLDAGDFRDEQTYHRGRLARALAALHGSGTVLGLRVGHDPAMPATETQPAREEQIRVEPGLAIDRAGRLIEVPREVCLRLPRWLAGQGAALGPAFHAAVSVRDRPTDPAATMDGIVVDVFVRYVACEVGRTPTFASGPFDALDATAASRLRDAYEVTLRLRDEPAPPAPRPQPEWFPDPPAGADAATVADLARDAILGAWDQFSDRDVGAGKLARLPEHPPGQEPTSVLLARLVVKAVQQADGTVTRTDDQAVAVLNHLRRFVYPVGVVARLAGLAAAG